MNKEELMIVAIKTVQKVNGEPRESQWPAGFTKELLCEMKDEGLIEWQKTHFEHYSRALTTAPTAITTMREYRPGPNAKEFPRMHS